MLQIIIGKQAKHMVNAKYFRITNYSTENKFNTCKYTIMQINILIKVAIRQHQ